MIRDLSLRVWVHTWQGWYINTIQGRADPDLTALTTDKRHDTATEQNIDI